MREKYESEMLQVLHEDMEDMHKSGIISDARMREFDELCLSEEALQDNNTHESLNIKQAELVTA